MNLYIETENGITKNHPALEENLIEAFGSVPSNWEAFVRIERPNPNIYQTMNDEPTYEKVDGVWTDVWYLREMTVEEKLAKQQDIIAKFRSRPQAENWATWTLDETKGEMIPPIPRPEFVEGVDIRWCGADNNWKEVPTRPVDDNQYKFDFIAWQWVIVVN